MTHPSARPGLWSRWTVLILLPLFIVPALFAQSGDIRLLVRADDIGCSHAANVACIRSFQEGIVRTVEIMVPCCWYPEAVQMLRQNPDLDVGVHLTLTSEWDLCKWGPLTRAPSLVDGSGYFYPKQKNWSDPDAKDAFWNAGPDLEEVEKELRAQIERALRDIPQVSHLSGHMGIGGVDPSMEKLISNLEKEYGLEIDLERIGVKHARWNVESDAGAERREEALVRLLEGLEPGTWMIVEHPGLDTPEMRAMGHEGYRHVAAHRDAVTRAFTSEKVREVIRNRKINLISYGDLKKD